MTDIRAFYDSGILCFASIDDILISEDSDPRLNIMRNVINEYEWSDSHPVVDIFEDYEGPLDSLYKLFLDKLGILIDATS